MGESLPAVSSLAGPPTPFHGTLTPTHTPCLPVSLPEPPCNSLFLVATWMPRLRTETLPCTALRCTVSWTVSSCCSKGELLWGQVRRYAPFRLFSQTRALTASAPFAGILPLACPCPPLWPQGWGLSFSSKVPASSSIKWEFHRASEPAQRCVDGAKQTLAEPGF